MKEALIYNGIEVSLHDFIVVDNKLIYGVFGSATQQNLNAVNGLFQGGMLRKKEATLEYLVKCINSDGVVYDYYKDWMGVKAHESGYFKEMEVSAQFSVMTLKSKTLFSDIYGKSRIIILGELSREEAILAWLDKYCPLPIPSAASDHLVLELGDYFKNKESYKGIKYLEIYESLLDENFLIEVVQETVLDYYNNQSNN